MPKFNDITTLIVSFGTIYNYNGLPFDENAKSTYLNFLKEFSLDFGEAGVRQNNVMRLSKYVVERDMKIVFVGVESNSVIRNMQERFVKNKVGWLFNEIHTIDSYQKLPELLKHIYTANNCKHARELGIVADTEEMIDAIKETAYQLVKFKK